MRLPREAGTPQEISRTISHQHNTESTKSGSRWWTWPAVSSCPTHRSGRALRPAHYCPSAYCRWRKTDSNATKMPDDYCPSWWGIPGVNLARPCNVQVGLGVNIISHRLCGICCRSHSFSWSSQSHHHLQSPVRQSLRNYTLFTKTKTSDWEFEKVLEHSQCN